MRFTLARDLSIHVANTYDLSFISHGGYCNWKDASLLFCYHMEPKNASQLQEMRWLLGSPPQTLQLKGYGPHPSPPWPDQFSSASNGRVVGSDTLFYLDSCGQKVSNQEI